MELPNKKYQIIYADPPWEYNDKRDNPTKNNPTGAGGATKHYNCMNLDEIKALPIDKIADTNSYLFMWCTCPKLDWGIEVIKSWGFKFVTMPFVWIKTRNEYRDKPRLDGIGFYTPNNAEFVLLGRKGKYWRASTKVKQVLLYPKLKHSEKPLEIRKRIEQLCGNVPRIELFARQRIKGWDYWGNEVPNDTQEELIELRS